MVCLGNRIYMNTALFPLSFLDLKFPKTKNFFAHLFTGYYAKLLAIAGIKKPEHVQFNDILPLARGEATRSYEEIYGAYLDAQRSITVGNEKLLVYPAVPVVRVYDILKDPLEITDIAKTQRGREIVAKLFPRLIKLQKKMGDSLDLTKSFPKLSSN